MRNEQRAKKKRRNEEKKRRKEEGKKKKNKKESNNTLPGAGHFVVVADFLRSGRGPFGEARIGHRHLLYGVQGSHWYGRVTANNI